MVTEDASPRAFVDKTRYAARLIVIPRIKINFPIATSLPCFSKKLEALFQKIRSWLEVVRVRDYDEPSFVPLLQSVDQKRPI